jgi:NAD(P)-dependent dehydrogenase (short-subunit alcohol dehydrogenase family)
VAASARGRLEGVRAVITGAASGIGRATAEAFHREGALAVLVDVDHEMLPALAAELDDRVTTCVADLGDPRGTRAVLAHTVRALGDVDVLVNNAGISSKTPFLDVGEDEWDRVVGVNVFGALALAASIGEEMAARGSGCILNVSSISGLGGGPSQSVYGITKGALLGLTRELAATFGPYGVRVNAVLPGVIDTPMVRRDLALSGDPDGTELAAWIRSAVPLSRMGRAEEVATVLAFLASVEGGPIRGAFVPVEGGFLSG